MGSCLLANCYLPCGGLNYFFTYWSYFHLIRKFLFFPDFQEMRPAGSEKHEINLAWPNDIAKVTTDNTLVTTTPPVYDVYNCVCRLTVLYRYTI